MEEAGLLSELGLLYLQMDRLKDAVIFFRQAADTYARSQDSNSEGRSRSNIGIALVKLQRYGEARNELHRTLQCKKPYGHAAEIWKTWDILYDLEQATGNPQTAAEARRQAMASYLAHRRAGGESQSLAAKLCSLTAQAIQEGQIAEIKKFLTQYQDANTPAWFKVMVPKLWAVIEGNRNPALPDDPKLDYSVAAELKLLLETL